MCIHSASGVTECADTQTYMLPTGHTGTQDWATWSYRYANTLSWIFTLKTTHSCFLLHTVVHTDFFLSCLHSYKTLHNSAWGDTSYPTTQTTVNWTVLKPETKPWTKTFRRLLERVDRPSPLMLTQCFHLLKGPHSPATSSLHQCVLTLVSYYVGETTTSTFSWDILILAQCPHFTKMLPCAHFDRMSGLC